MIYREPTDLSTSSRLDKRGRMWDDPHAVSEKRHDDWVSVRISADERKELERLATQEERTMNGMIRLAIRALIESRKEVTA